jgi:polysaccharide export outer membrane protein
MNRIRTRRLTLLALIGCIAAVLSVSGCTSSPPAPPVLEEIYVEQIDLTATNAVALPAATEDPSYRLGIGDMLAISIYAEESSVRNVPVDPSGNISYLMTGTVPAGGRTIEELRADLQKRVSEQLAHSLVQVVPVRFGSQTYTILGELNYPGTYLIEGRTTVFDAIARARGIRTGQFRNSTAEMADYRSSVLMRNGRVVPVDFEALIGRGDATQNVELQNGDILNIPSSLVRNVYVLGEVHFPRTVGFVSSLSLMQALTEARGLKNTSDGRIVVVRGSLAKPEVRVVHFEKILDAKQPNLSLAPGDIVYVPPRRLVLMREIVETAITAFANTVSAGSASQLYQESFGPEEKVDNE